MKKIIALALALLLVTFAFAACGDPSEGSGTTGTTNNTTGTTGTDGSETTTDTNKDSDGTESSTAPTTGETDPDTDADTDNNTDTSADGNGAVTSDPVGSTEGEPVYTVSFYVENELVGEGHFPEGYTLVASDYPALPNKPGYKYSWPKVVVGAEDMMVVANCEDDNSTPIQTFG